MRSLLEKIMNTFFEKSSPRNKHLMYLQRILIFIAIYVWLQARINIGTSAYYIYSGILDILIGLMMLLIGIENYIGNKKIRSNIWFGLFLL